MYPHTSACPALFLRLQFELKKAVDTRTIGCAAVALSSPPSPDLLDYFFLSPISFSLPSFSFGLLTMKMKIRTEMHLSRSSSRFASRRVKHNLPLSPTSLSLAQTLRSNFTFSLNTLTLSIIMSPTKQSLSLLCIPFSSRSRSWDFRVFVGFSLYSGSFIRAFSPFP